MKRSDRAEAIALRKNGVTYQAILKRFGMAKSTLWRWLKAEGLVDGQSQQYTERRLAAQKKASMAVHSIRLERTQKIMSQACREIGPLSNRDLMMLGIALYWAEGAKQKPHNVSQPVHFSNSDPEMVRLFMWWLQCVCHLSIQQMVFEIYIHESADVQTARQFWSSALLIPQEQFRVRLKKHKRSSYRRNVGKSYVGLVRVRIAQSTDFNRRIAGWIQGLCQGIGESAKGKPGDFGSPYPGSIPGSPAFLSGVSDDAGMCEDSRRILDDTLWLEKPLQNRRLGRRLVHLEVNS